MTVDGASASYARVHACVYLFVCVCICAFVYMFVCVYNCLYARAFVYFGPGVLSEEPGVAILESKVHFLEDVHQHSHTATRMHAHMHTPTLGT